MTSEIVRTKNKYAARSQAIYGVLKPSLRHSVSDSDWMEKGEGGWGGGGWISLNQYGSL